MKKNIRLLSAVLAMTVVGSLAACSTSPAVDSGAQSGFAKDSTTLVFGVVPDSVDTETNYQPLTDYIGAVTGKSVDYHESTDYAALIEAAVAGKIDVASFSGFTYVIATNKGAKLTPVSSIVTQVGGEPGYYSQAIVPKGSAITSLADFKGKKVCFVDPSSTSGYLFPSYELQQIGINVDTDLTPVFAGKHDVSVAKVAEGKECEAGFAEDSEVVKSTDVTVVKSTHVPGAPLVVSSNLPDDLKQTLVGALSHVSADQVLAKSTTKSPAAFRAIFAETQPVTDADYDLIRDICEKTGAKQCQA